MANLCVIAAGLFAIAPARESIGSERGRAAILMMREVADGVQVESRKVPAHVGEVRFRTQQVERPLPLSGVEIRFEPEGNDSCQIRNPQSFLHLRDFNDSVPPARPGCTGDDSRQSCEVQGSRGLIGRVVLQGGEIRPIQLQGITALSDVRTSITNQVGGSRTVNGSQMQARPQKPAANGLLYLRRILGGNVSMVLGKQEFSLAPAPAGDVARLNQLLGENEETWFVVWVTNTRRPSDDLSDYLGNHDPDFDFLYDLLQPGNVTRWVPILPGNDVGKITPPEKCMPVIVDR